MTEKMIRDAYCRIRKIDQTIPDDVLDFMKDAAIEKLRKLAVIYSVPIKKVKILKEFCQCKNPLVHDIQCPVSNDI